MYVEKEVTQKGLSKILKQAVPDTLFWKLFELHFIFNVSYSFRTITFSSF